MSEASKPGELWLKPVDGEAEFALALAIRVTVFVQEQGVPADMELDEHDPAAFHLLARLGALPVGTGRLIAPAAEAVTGQPRWGKVGRMAILREHRKAGIGRAILEGLEVEARRRGYGGLALHAQLQARGFYLAAGYCDAGPVFEEAGLPHLEMHKLLR